MLIISVAPRHDSDWSYIPPCSLGFGWSSRRYPFGSTRGDRAGASKILTRFRLLSQRPLAGQSRDPPVQDQEHCLTTQQQGFASQIFYILTLWTTKTSILLLYMRLSPSGGHRIASWTMLVSSAVWALASIILICVPCNPAQFYTSRAGECTDMVRREHTCLL